MTPEQVVKQYKGIVIFHVRKWTRRHRQLKPFYEDLVQDGNEGLLRALGKFDPSRGAFETIAHGWVAYCVRIGATRYVGQTSRPAHYKPARKEVWAADFLATDSDGAPLSPDAFHGNAKTPEELVMLKELADGLVARTQDRDGKIFRMRLEAEESYEGTHRRRSVGRGISSASIGKELGLSRERVRQILKKVEGGLREWGASIEQEAA